LRDCASKKWRLSVVTSISSGSSGVTGVDDRRVDREVDHDLGAERLDEQHLGVELIGTRHIDSDGGILEVLRTDTDDHLLSVVAAQCGSMLEPGL
jgi:hypothetical protein